MQFIKRYIAPFFNTRAAGIYMLLFAIAIGTATFVENDFGTSSAQKVIFKSKWFELLLLMFSITILVNIVKFRMFQQKKWALLLFHSSMIIILIGAGVTRYYGFEGVMHIRENDKSNTITTAETYLNFDINSKGRHYKISEPVLFATLGNNDWSSRYSIDDHILDIKVKDFIPNPKQIMKDAGPDGLATLKVVFGGRSGREEYYLKQNEKRAIRSVNFNFTDKIFPSAINILYRNDSILIQSDQVLFQTVMATQIKDTLSPNGQYYPLRLRSLYEIGSNSFVFGDFKESAMVTMESESPKVKGESLTALVMEVGINNNHKETVVYGKKGQIGRGSVLRFDDVSVEVSYGSKEKFLPFSIKLIKFIMDKYPGTNSASSYASDVQLIDDRKNIKKDYKIYMNNILDHDGYRFFQSSFDPDEQGTYLSVNHDFWGTWISYIGYILLTLGMIMSLFSKKSRFQYVSKQIKKMRANTSLVFLAVLFLSNGLLHAQNALPSRIINIDHANKFAKLIVQDHKGRMKPVHTLNREVMRKLTRSESLQGLSADQVVLGMLTHGHDWQNVPMIKLGKHSKIPKLLGVSHSKASYNDFFSKVNGKYKLRDEMRRAYSLQPIDRGVYEKELMKLDEKINIASMVYSGRIFKLIPILNDELDSWVSSRSDDNSLVYPIAKKFFSSYSLAVQEALKTNDYSYCNKIIDELSEYQKTIGASVIPSDTVINAELLLNKLNVFGRLAVYYILLGLAFLFFLFLSVFKPNLKLSRLYQILFWIVVTGFVFHTIGLGLRWYISGRAPWSNGYESMIYIAWTSTLAGILFARKSLGGLAATMVLAATVLLVAHLSYLDPEITPLVPVLKSYWLTIHVSLEAGSYGFLMLGAIIGMINLILMIFITKNNEQRVHRIIKEMSYISEMTLIAGLFMVSIGTYLGGVWANESWGRYWGWDAKETWALVTILVYAFILHMRIIPKMSGLFSYNVATIFGWASVIMTYYGVNYYLSGLHSYAAGDPIPIPNWVYIVVVVVFIITILAFWRKKKFKLIT